MMLCDAYAPLILMVNLASTEIVNVAQVVKSKKNRV